MKIILFSKRFAKVLFHDFKSVVFLIYSVLFFVNIHVFDYPAPRLSAGLFRLVPTSPDINRGSTVLIYTAQLK